MILSEGSVRIVADDLTGALDAAAPFARPDQPVGLVLHETYIPNRHALTISTESRNHDPKAAAEATIRACDVLGAEGALWFHKIDSVLRGQPFVTTAAMMQHLNLPSCMFAPAFPKMGRITIDGQHMVAAEGKWIASERSDIWAELRAVGLTPQYQTSPPTAGANALIVNASEQADLNQAVAEQSDPSLLWVGSRALAEALTGDIALRPCPSIAILVIGTSQPATRAQVAFSASRLSRVAESKEICPNPGQCVIIDPIPYSSNAAKTRDAVYSAALQINPAGLEGRSLFVTGGETLSVVLRAVGARSLDCLGEVGPGLPISVVKGGRLDGCSIVSKSGGFGAPDLLNRYL